MLRIDFSPSRLGKVNRAMSLTPGFSPVGGGDTRENRFNGFSRAGKPLKRLAHLNAFVTRLKPGVNETHCIAAHFCNGQ